MVTLANGPHSVAKGLGWIGTLPLLHLDIVLYVSSYPVCLISFNKLQALLIVLLRSLLTLFLCRTGIWDRQLEQDMILCVRGFIFLTLHHLRQFYFWWDPSKLHCHFGHPSTSVSPSFKKLCPVSKVCLWRLSDVISEKDKPPTCVCWGKIRCISVLVIGFKF